MMIKLLVLCCFVAFAACSPLQYYYDIEEEPTYYRRIEKRSVDLPYQDEDGYNYVPEEFVVIARQRRSLQPGGPSFPNPNQQPPTSITPHVTKQDGTTNVGAVISHKTPNSEVTGHWNKNVRGPGRSKPNWGIRGTYRW